MAQAVITTGHFSFQNPKPAEEIREFYSSYGAAIAKSRNSLVLYAQERASGSHAAIKCQLFSAEARIESIMMQVIHHPHAIQFRHAFEDPEETNPRKFYIAMDYIPKKNLEEAFFDPRTPEEKLTLDEIGCIVRQILEFLDNLHSHDFIFFDLKPSNLIFRRASRSLTVIDFGSVRSPSLDPAIRIPTTPAFRAPEFILGQSIDTSYDDWTLGCLIFKLLTGSYLFSAPDSLAPEDMDHYHLQRIVQEIGLPRRSYLKTCKRAHIYFDAQLQFRKKFDLTGLKNWRLSIREAGEKNLWPSEEVEGYIEMIGQLLRYENRSIPEAFQQHPLFTKEVVVHLNFDPEKKCKMYIQRASTIAVALRVLKLSHLPNPDLALDFHEPISTCLHLPRDPEEAYIVILEKAGCLSKKRFFLDQGAILDVRPLQQEFTMPPQPRKRALGLPSGDEEKERRPAKKARTDIV